jgi:hypothetical protein
MRFDGCRQRRGEIIVNLDCNNALRVWEQRQRQTSKTWPNFQHNVIGGEVGGTSDPSNSVRIDDEVLSTLLRWTNAQPVSK